MYIDAYTVKINWENIAEKTYIPYLGKQYNNIGYKAVCILILKMSSYTFLFYPCGD